jgi:putative phosphoesterase
MRIATISDMHGNAVAFEAVVDDLKKQSPDAIIFLGDAVMRGPQPAECVELLYSLNPLVAVRGNYDHMFTRFPKPDWKPQDARQEMVFHAFEYDLNYLSQEDQQWLGNLAMEDRSDVNGTQIECYHAAPDSLIEVTYPWAPLDDLDKLHRDEKTKLVLFGHVHHAFVRQARGRLVVNSGSIGTPFDGDNRASYAVIDIEKDDIAVQLRRVSYDIDKAIRIAKERSMPNVELFEYALKYARYPYNNIPEKSNA